MFERNVLPILTSNCLGCHGGLRQKGGLDLRSIPLMLKGGDDGPVIKAGTLAASPMWTAISKDEMPKGDKKLSPPDKETIRAWIAGGMPTVTGRRTAVDMDPLLAASTSGPNAAHDVAAAIDRHVDRGLAEMNLTPAPQADDAEFLRRIYLDLTGRVPTAEQAASFLDDGGADKRAKLIDALLDTPQFGEQFGRTWREWISPPELPSDPNGGKQPHTETQNLGKWIGDRVTAGDGWDHIVRQMVGAEGEIKSNPGVVFLGLQGEGGKTTPDGSARGVASLFMGVQLQCAQCHDDPYRTWPQQDFWGLAAFFKKANGDFNKVYEVPPPPKPNKDPKKAEEEAKKREEAAKKAKAVDPATFGKIVIPPKAFKNAGKMVAARVLGADHDFKPDGDEPLRPHFLDWLTAKDNPYFARSFVNRTWFYFFNRGIVHPVDDFRELNPPSHPGLLNLLEREFLASDYNVKHIVRCICNTQAYQRTSRPCAGEPAAAATLLVARFGRMPARVMSADVLYESLKLAYGDPKLDLRPIDPKDGNTNGESAPVGDAYLEFRRSFCTNKEDTTDFTYGIPQLLTMMNHPRLTAGSKALDAFLKANPSATPQRVTEWLYLSTLSRRPDPTETAEAVKFIAASPDASKSYVSVLWMLVNRSEYLLVR